MLAEIMVKMTNNSFFKFFIFCKGTNK